MKRRPAQSIPRTVEFLEELGFAFGIDFDELPMVSYPKRLNPVQIADKLLTTYENGLVNYLLHRANRERWQLVGGPQNGCGHDYEIGDVIAIPNGRRNWSAYLVSPDGRAFFQGFATSKRAAKCLELKPSPVKHSKSS